MSEESNRAVSPLRQRMIEDMTLRNLSRHTIGGRIRACREAVRQSLRGRSPREGSAANRCGSIYCTWFRRSTRDSSAATTLPAGHCAEFLYRVTLGRDGAFGEDEPGAQAQRLPAVSGG